MADRTPRPARSAADAGSALVITMVVILLGALVVTPMLTYSINIGMNRKASHERIVRTEIVEAGAKLALLDPVGLYRRCAAATATTSVDLVDPAGAVPTSNRCFLMGEQRRDAPEDLRYSVATTRAGSVAPVGDWRIGSTYPGSGGADAGAWVSESTANPRPDKIWLPRLPFRTVSERSSRGYAMPGGNCTVYFPGTYKSALTVNNSGSNPVYFASGVYYFESSVTLRASKPIILGAGAVPGCTDDETAARDAIGAPGIHHISGGGVTFIFGDGGSLLIDDQYGSGDQGTVVFNRRYVSSSRLSTDSTRGISVMTVNGQMSDGALRPLATPDLQVPPSFIVGTGQLANEQSYRPSNFTGAGSTPVVTIYLQSTRAMSVSFGGYIEAPQGRVRIVVSGTGAPRKSLLLDGGVLAATFELPRQRPETFRVGIDNPIVIRNLRIETTTTQGRPQMWASTVVKVRDDGEYGVQSYETGVRS